MQSLTEQFCQQLQRKQNGTSDLSHLNFCFSQVTGLVGYSLALNGLIFKRRVLSNFWKIILLKQKPKVRS